MLLAIIPLWPNSYGAPIRRALSRRFGRIVPVGAIYTALERLEAKGFISSWTGGATAERGGGAKRFYRIEEPGLHALDQVRATTRMGAPIAKVREAPSKRRSKPKPEFFHTNVRKGL